MLEMKAERLIANRFPNLFIGDAARMLAQVFAYLRITKEDRHHQRMDAGNGTTQPWLRLGFRLGFFCHRLTHIARMAQRITAWLRINAQPMRPIANLDARPQFTGRGVEGVNLAMVAAREPERSPIG